MRLNFYSLAVLACSTGASVSAIVLSNEAANASSDGSLTSAAVQLDPEFDLNYLSQSGVSLDADKDPCQFKTK